MNQNTITLWGLHKRRIVKTIFFASLLVGAGSVSLSSCKDEVTVQELGLAQNQVELQEGDSTVLAVQSGNGDYLVSQSVEGVVSSKFTEEGLLLKALKIGTTKLWITDNAGKSFYVDVKVSVSTKPRPVYTGDRAMIVTYDPTANATRGQTSGYTQPLVSWRLLGTDPKDIAFDVYKKEGSKAEVKLNENPITDASSFQDNTTFDPNVTNTYRVAQAGTDKTLCTYDLTPALAKNFFRAIKLNTNVPDPALTYQANDAQVGDLDGDGQMEIVLKRQPYDGANQGGWHDGTTLLEAYKLDGTFLWQIDMGVNIRSGSHYTSFVVYDFDGDGKAEVAIRTSEGTKFGDGKLITGKDGKVTDYRWNQGGGGWYSGKSINSINGIIFDSPEYISICNGATGGELARTENIPRGGTGSDYERAKYWNTYWGDDYGNRMDRFFIGVAYLDGVPKDGIRTTNPQLIITRGVYLNWQVEALDYKGGKLSKRWVFDTKDNPKFGYAAGGLCSHSFRVADLNGDGFDEILYGSTALSHTGQGLWCSGNGHGDALHVGKFSQTHSGLQIVASFEEPGTYNKTGHGYGCQLLDAATGKLIAGIGAGSTVDVGRCLVADVDKNSPGQEFWCSLGGGIYSTESGAKVNAKMPTYKGGGTSYNNAIFWTGDLTRQMLDDTIIQGFGPTKPWCDKRGMSTWERVLGLGYYGLPDGGSAASNNSTKANPCYYGDFLGDYREEVIMRSKNNNYLYIFSTNHPTTHRFVHFMEDHNYDMSQAMQNMGYNQPTHLGYYVGADMK